MTKTKKQKSRRCSIYLNAETERKAKEIGYGNLSHGVRVAVEIAHKRQKP